MAKTPTRPSDRRGGPCALPTGGRSGGGKPRPYVGGGSPRVRRFVALAAAAWLGFLGVADGQEPAGDAAAFQALGLDSPRLLEAPAGPPLAGAELERRTLEVTSLMRCPVCQGLSIADSPTESAQAMKREVREMLAAGYSREQVLGYFERSYGEFIRLSPKPTGFNLLVWVLPIVGILAGALLIAARMRSAKAAARGATAAPEAESEAGAGAELDPYLERVRKEAGS